MLSYKARDTAHIDSCTKIYDEGCARASNPDSRNFRETNTPLFPFPRAVQQVNYAVSRKKEKTKNTYLSRW